MLKGGRAAAANDARLFSVISKTECVSNGTRTVSVLQRQLRRSAQLLQENLQRGDYVDIALERCARGDGFAGRTRRPGHARELQVAVHQFHGGGCPADYAVR